MIREITKNNTSIPIDKSDKGDQYQKEGAEWAQNIPLHRPWSQKYIVNFIKEPCMTMSQRCIIRIQKKLHKQSGQTKISW